MPAVCDAWSFRSNSRGCVFLAAVLLSSRVGLASAPAEGAFASVTNVAQVRAVAAQNPRVCYEIDLRGTVLWARPEEGRLVLSDPTGAAELEAVVSNALPSAGSRARVHGLGTVGRSGAAFRLGVVGPVVDNDGVHSMLEKSGAVYLAKGEQPIRLDWFNGEYKYGLVVEYEGPGFARQPIPDAVLYRKKPGPDAGGTPERGLDCRCYDVPGEVLPDFTRMQPVKTGVVTNFDANVLARPEHSGVRFEGYIEIAREGLYVFYTQSDDGSLLYVGGPSMDVADLGFEGFPTPRRIAIGETMGEATDWPWVEVEGRVTLIRRTAGGTDLELSGGGGHMWASVAGPIETAGVPALNSRVRVTGFCEATWTADGQRVAGVVFVPGARQIEYLKPPAELLSGSSTNVEPLPVLTSAIEVHRLKREEAQRGYPVRIRGVVTSLLPEHQAFTIQDSTRGLYVVDTSESRATPPKVGEFLEVEGQTDPHLFAPIVNAQRVRSLGAGRRPQPVQPAWDQLMNGSLDAQYVEIQGIVTATVDDRIVLRTRGGPVSIDLRLAGGRKAELGHYENALVRVRGCLFATWDYLTHQVKVGEIRIYEADILVDEPAPANLFSTQEKTPSELLLFDPLANEFERVKVSGQILYVREPEYFLSQGGRGVRLIAKQAATVQVGDLVEAVGFPELMDSGAPALREAVLRKTGHARLPLPKSLSNGDLMKADYDSTLVKVRGVLAAVRRWHSDEILEMQSGVPTFVARFSGASPFLESLAPGSKLELVGVYAGQGGNRAVGQGVTSFELLLSHPSDVTVLARPPWWTPERLLVIVGVLACVLAATVLWIKQLHRQVEERTTELGEQIQERQRVEHQRAMEQERARIAQDLHDELGSGITEISMLAARARATSGALERSQKYLEHVGDKAREMVTALDEIVWAMNPRHDSLASMVSYFSLYADRFLGLANIPWRMEGPVGPGDCVVDSRYRHQLFLAFKEALTNVVRHSGATEVRLGLGVEGASVVLSVADNGRGLPAEAPRDGMDGVANMQSRLEKLGGRFEVTSEPGQGTMVKFCVPLG